MKLKKEIVLGNIDGQDFAIASGSLSDKFHGLINNNKTANYIFQPVSYTHLTLPTNSRV